MENLRPVVCIAAIVAASASCVSSGRHRDELERSADLLRDLRVQQVRTRALEEQVAALNRENARLHEQFSAAQAAVPRMQAELLGCQEKLNSLENTSIAECLAQLQGTRDVMTEKEQKAYYKGMLDVWAALSVRGAASKDAGWLIDDYYYTIAINFGSKEIFSNRIQTKTEQGAVARTFSELLSITQVVAAFRRK
jgi:hypothetical protein